MSERKSYYVEHPEELSNYVERNDLVAVEAILKAHSHLANKLYGNHTLLAEPCRRGHNNMVQLLLRYGVNINNCSRIGCPVIWRAVRYQHADTVRILVESGADIEMNCMFPNFRCLDYAILFGFYEIALYLYQKTTNKQLKTSQEYERLKKELKVGRYVNYSVVIEGLLHETQPSELLDHLKRPKQEKGDGQEADCCSWCCGLFVFDPKRDLPRPPQPPTDRNLRSDPPQA